MSGTDVGLLVALRAWAREGEEALARAAEHYGERSPTEAAAAGEHLAGLLAARWRALDLLIGQRLAAERARLARAVEEAQGRADTMHGRFDAAERHAADAGNSYGYRAEAARRALAEVEEVEGRLIAAEERVDLARAALAAFDAAVRGGADG